MPGSMGEFDLIDRFARGTGLRGDVRVPIGDDAAVLRMPPQHDLVVAVDTMVEGVHFRPGLSAEDLGHKALAVNLSDLAAMGAEPVWATLALTLPEAPADWVHAFARGFFRLAEQHRMALVGGDTTRGPLSITVQALGRIPRDAAIQRSGAQVGDQVWVTGTLGDAAMALRQMAAEQEPDAELLARLDRPTPRIEAGLVLRGMARACIDLSDGLMGDLTHLLKASNCGARLQVSALPSSAALMAACPDADLRRELQLVGGDDYELLFTVAAEDALELRARLGVAGESAVVIGEIVAEPGIELVDAGGATVEGPPPIGWRHF